MDVLIVFATVEGQTAKIARFIEGKVREACHDAELLHAGADTAAASLDGYDKVILAAPVHERRHPREFEAFLSSRRGELQVAHTLLISVSLSAAFPEGLEEAGEYVIELKMRTGFTPNAELLVAGAVRTSRYDYFARQVVRHVVLRDRAVDPTVKEHEFTDWRTLSFQLTRFLDRSEAEKP